MPKAVRSFASMLAYGNAKGERKRSATIPVLPLLSMGFKLLGHLETSANFLDGNHFALANVFLRFREDRQNYQ